VLESLNIRLDESAAVARTRGPNAARPPGRSRESWAKSCTLGFRAGKKTEFSRGYAGVSHQVGAAVVTGPLAT